jgi:hypothetical protein
VPSRCGATIRSSRFVIGRFCSNHLPVRAKTLGVSSATIFNVNRSAIPSLSSMRCHHICALVCVSLVVFPFVYFDLDLYPVLPSFLRLGFVSSVPFLSSHRIGLYFLLSLRPSRLCVASMRLGFVYSAVGEMAISCLRDFFSLYRLGFVSCLAFVALCFGLVPPQWGLDVYFLSPVSLLYIALDSDLYLMCLDCVSPPCIITKACNICSFPELEVNVHACHGFEGSINVVTCNFTSTLLWRDFRVLMRSAVLQKETLTAQAMA